MLSFGGARIGKVFFGAAPIKEAFFGNARVFSAGPVKPVEEIVLDYSAHSARYALNALIEAQGVKPRTVEELPFDIHFVGEGTTSWMFSDCSSLRVAPRMNTTNVVDMTRMFMGCTSLEEVPPLDTRNVTTLKWMFSKCRALADGHAVLLGKHPGVETGYAIADSGLSRVPFFDYDAYRRDGTLIPID